MEMEGGWRDKEGGSDDEDKQLGEARVQRADGGEKGGDARREGRGACSEHIIEGWFAERTSGGRYWRVHTIEE